MKVEDLKISNRYWYISNGCYLIFKGIDNRIKKDKYIFEDFGDKKYHLDEKCIELWLRKEVE